MGDLIPIIEGPVKFRDGKKWKNRYACVTRLSPVADSLTLQLWKDRKDWERNPPSKGSLALQEYLGWEAGFTLDKESQTLALILKEDVIILALDNRETLMRWQVRVTGQFEEGQHFNSHLIQVPAKSKLPQGPVKIHIQNRRFSMTHGVPPRLVHSWNLADLRRYGGLENGRFCFEGGSRCGKGEGVHVLRLDDPEDLQLAFDAATKGKLESKRKSVYKTMPKSPSLSSHMDGCGGMSAAQSVLSVASTLANGRHFDGGRHINNHIEQMSEISSTDSMAALIHATSMRGSRDDLLRTRSSSRSRFGNNSMNWSVNEGSSCETMSIALSELTEASCLTSNQMSSLVNISNGGQSQQQSPEHLVNRKDLLQRMGIPTTARHSRIQPGSRSMGNAGDFVPQWSMDLTSCSSGSFKDKSSRSIDRISISSHESQVSSGSSSCARSNYDTPKAAIGSEQNTTSDSQHQQRRSWSVHSGGATSQCRPPQSCTSPPLTPKSHRSRQMNPKMVETEDNLRLMQNYETIPCGCENKARSNCAELEPKNHPKSYENYDIPRNLCKQEALQYYDTPRNIKEALDTSTTAPSINPYGNYDVPHQGLQPIPVVKKSCGCIMKLVPTVNQKESGGPTWTGVESNPEVRVARVKLTGNGKMPVADMRLINNAFPFQCPNGDEQNGQSRLAPQQHQSLCVEPNVSGLPPKSPVYAVVNKINKKKQQTQSPQHTRLLQQQPQSPQHSQQQQPQNVGLQYHNYCNVAPLLGDVVKQSGNEFQSNVNNGGGHYYENSAAVLARLNTDAPLANSASGMGDYIPMDSQMFQANTSKVPLIPFEPFNYATKGGDVIPPPKYESIDPISQKLQEFQDALDTDETTYASLVNNTFYVQLDGNNDNNDSKANNCLFNLCDLSQTLQLDGEVDWLDPTNDVRSAKSMEILMTTGWLNNLTPDPASKAKRCRNPGVLTIPRSSNKHSNSGNNNQNQSVTMRRSSSVPCKPVTDRGSTSSSDSGFSPG